jgi:hypothetical protein
LHELAFSDTPPPLGQPRGGGRPRRAPGAAPLQSLLPPVVELPPSQRLLAGRARGYRLAASTAPRSAAFALAPPPARHLAHALEPHETRLGASRPLMGHHYPHPSAPNR